MPGLATNKKSRSTHESTNKSIMRMCVRGQILSYRLYAWPEVRCSMLCVISTARELIELCIFDHQSCIIRRQLHGRVDLTMARGGAKLRLPRVITAAKLRFARPANDKYPSTVL